MTLAANLVSSGRPWWVGVPTKLIHKKTLVEAGENRLPVHTLTFAIPEKADFSGRARPHASVCIDLGDVVKMVIPGYKPKSYSISALREESFDVTFKVYPNGRASGYLDRLKVGDEIGTFGMTAGRTRNPGSFVGIVSYGVGITEGLPVAQAELEKGTQKVVLLWASRTVDDTFWHKDIQELKKRFPDQFEMVHILSRQKHENCLHGRITPEILHQVFHPATYNLDKEGARFLSVGTKDMMKQTDNMFEAIGYDMPHHALLPKAS